MASAGDDKNADCGKIIAEASNYSKLNFALLQVLHHREAKEANQLSGDQADVQRAGDALRGPRLSCRTQGALPLQEACVAADSMDEATCKYISFE